MLRNWASDSSAKLAHALGHAVQLVDGGVVQRHRGHQLLGQYVERVAHDPGVLDLARVHALGHHRRLEQVGPVTGEDAPTRGHAHLVPGPANALQPGGNRAGGGHLDHQVDRAHVDAQLQAGGGDQACELTPLQLVLDQQPTLARQRPVMGLHQLDPVRVGRTDRFGAGGDHVGAARRRRSLRLEVGLVVEFVESAGQTLGHAPGVDEDQRRAMLLHQLEQGRMHRGPDAAPLRPGGGRTRLGFLDDRAERRHVLDRHPHLQVEFLGDTGVDDAHRARLGGRPAHLPTSEEPGHGFEGPLRRGQSDALRGRVVVAGHPRGETLQAERHVGAPLGRRQRVNLVDDHRLHTGESLPGGRRQQQVERLGGGDQDVGRVAGHLAPVLLRGVAGAQPHRRGGELPAYPLRRQLDAPDRTAQVLLDVDRQRPQRRQVHHPGANSVRPGIGTQPVDRPQECRQRLARPGRGAQQGVLAGRDRRPRQRLGRGRLGKGRAKPGPHRLGKCRPGILQLGLRRSVGACTAHFGGGLRRWHPPPNRCRR